VLDALTMYDLPKTDIDLFMMSRPWLSSDDFYFNFEKVDLNDVLEDQIEREIGYWLDSNSTSTLKKIS